MQKLTPCLWIGGDVDAAANYYARIFKGAISGVQKMPDGSTLVAHVDILGTDFTVLGTAGPDIRFTDAISFSIDCKDQAEVDYYWNALTADGGQESMCGWLKDKNGVSWQIVPEALPRAIGGSDKAGAGRAMQAMLTMRKIDVAAIERAYAGK